MSSTIDPIVDHRTGEPRSAAMPAPRTVLDLVVLLRTNWRFVGRISMGGAVLGLALAFLLPARYTAITTILPPAASSSLASAFAAQSGELSLLAGLAGGFGIRNPADLCMIMLRSRTVEDAVIHRFNLMREYRKKRLSDTRTALERSTSVTLNLKSGLIAIAARDHDPARAAELANGYVDEFRKFTASLAITEAGQRRQFFEQQLLQAKGDLTQSEEALKQTQQATGMLDPVGTSRASLESAVAIRAQIAARQVELRTMSTFATDANPRYVQLKQALAALESQEAELAGAAPDAAGDPLVPTGKIPEAGAEYLRRLRDVKYNEAVVAILARQFEIARLDEARQGSGVQVVDPAVVPDKRSSPKRLATLLGCTVLAFLFAASIVIHLGRSPNWRFAWKNARVAVALFLLMAASLARAQSADVSAQSNPYQIPDCADLGLNAENIPCTNQGVSQPGALARPVLPVNGLGAYPNVIRDRGLERGTGETTAAQSIEDAQRRIRVTRPPRPSTEFEQMAADSAGKPLAVFGQAFFDQPPETFAPADGMQVPSDYVIGPGDELHIRIWGQIDADLRIEADRSGQIFIPQVGEVPIAGVRYDELEGYLTRAVARVYKSFNLAVSMGHLHAIQVFVVGQAKAPGTYTIGSLSTLVNAVFSSGGPLPQGSLRHIQLRRGDRLVKEFDLYDLLIKGDKSRDLPLQSGDVVLIPPVGPLVAIAGSVNSPAIYELKDAETIGQLIVMAGGVSTLADGSTASIERIRDDRSRAVLQFPLDANGLTTRLKGGDVVRISSIVPRFDDTVTLRGYVADPGRYPFAPGMHVRDLLPDARALLSREYWLNRASITDARQTGYPVRKQIPLPQSNAQGAGSDQAAYAQAVQQGTQTMLIPLRKPETRAQTIPEYYSDLAQSETIADPGTSSDPNQAKQPENRTETLTQDLRKLVPSVNWRYALIQRVDAVTLQTQLISFDLGKAVIDGDAASNVALQPGDIVTVFSQQDITAPQQAQTRYVKVEGEVEHPGVYELAEGQTLQSVLNEAGGLTAKAYPYGARLTRESARVEQQKGIDEMVRTAEAEVRASTVAAAASGDSGSVGALQNAQQSLIASLKSLQASGRVVLAMDPDAKTVSDFPAIALEDSDRIVIPTRPDTVTVSGAVYNPASFAFDPHRKVGDYLLLAGKGGLNANQHHEFVLRADGTVISRQEAGKFLHNDFEQLPMHPGDQIVVPEKVDNAVARALHEWPQVFSPFALTALAIATVAK